ncbi:MAG: hypothetical protein Q4B63_05875 [Clostridium perfringens]|nr:hypothetical protein [Clostridium perfringens]
MKSKSALGDKSSIEIIESDSSDYESEEIFKNIENILNLAYFPGTYSLEVFNNEINLTLNREYFKYVLDELKEIIDISSIEYLDDKFVVVEGIIK